ncbi:hypothetical protein diail_5845 [Diaporthe ilicicola]|nr:hypothetical protein diail_5845 [Diaporthe ilicicola]
MPSTSMTSTLVEEQGRHFSKAETRRYRQMTQRRKGKKARPEPKEPIYVSKSRSTPQVADPAAPGDVQAHEYDDSSLLQKLMPRGQEHRGCKTRDVDLRIKRDNKAVSTGTFQNLDNDDSAYGEDLE